MNTSALKIRNYERFNITVTYKLPYSGHKRIVPGKTMGKTSWVKNGKLHREGRPAWFGNNGLSEVILDNFVIKSSNVIFIPGIDY